MGLYFAKTCSDTSKWWCSMQVFTETQKNGNDVSREVLRRLGSDEKDGRVVPLCLDEFPASKKIPTGVPLPWWASVESFPDKGTPDSAPCTPILTCLTTSLLTSSPFSCLSANPCTHLSRHCSVRKGKCIGAFIPCSSWKMPQWVSLRQNKLSGWGKVPPMGAPLLEWFSSSQVAPYKLTCPGIWSRLWAPNRLPSRNYHFIAFLCGQGPSHIEKNETQ